MILCMEFKLMNNKVNYITLLLPQKFNSESLSTIIYVEHRNNMITSKIFGAQATDISAIGATITALVSIILAFHTIIKYREDKKEQQTIFLRDRKVELATTAKEKIEKFYGPFNSLLEASRIIYGHFALEEKEQIKTADVNFRTLRYLNEIKRNNSKKIDEHDKELLELIINISDKITDLIETNSGFVDNPELHTLLGKLIAHYKILKSAANGKLNKNDPTLEEVVFPLEINGALENEIRKLKKIIDFDTIKNTSTKENKTIDFYNKNYIKYFQRTYSTDMSDIYSNVIKHLKPGAFVLDAGCGVGRDTEYFIKNGYKVTSFDAAQKMVDLCNQYSFAFCERLSFDEVDFPPKYDLVWACASLLHLDENDFKDAVYRLYKSARKGGIIYFSLKELTNNDNERDFYYYPYKLIHEIFVENLKMTKVATWKTVSNITGTGESFENYIFKK